MAEDTEVKVEITATSDKLKDGMGKAKDAVREGVDGIKGHLGDVVGMAGKVAGAFAAMAAVVAGVGVFKAAIGETLKFTGEANKLGKALGITATEASTLNVALGDIYSSAENFIGAANQLTRQVRTNEDAMNAMGLKTRDSHGEFRKMNDIMMDSLTVLRSYKEGTDRNMAAQAMFKGAAGEAMTLLKLNNEVLDEAKKKQQELGLIVGQENVAAAKAYKASMNDVGDVMTALQKAIGDAVMPVFTELGNWFSSIGPAAVTVIKGAIGGLVSVFWGIKLAVEIFWEAVKFSFNAVATSAITMAEVVERALRWDFTGAKAAFDKGAQSLATSFETQMDAVVQKSQDTQEKLRQLFDRPTAIVEGPAAKGKSFTDPNAKVKDDKDFATLKLAVIKAQLEAEYAIQKDNLTQAQALYAYSYSQNLISIREYYDAQLAIEEEMLGKERALKQNEIEAMDRQLKASQAKGTPEGERETLKIRAQLVKLTGELQIIESHQATAAINNATKRIDAENNLRNKLEDITISSNEKLANAEVDKQRAIIDAKFQMGTLDQAQVLEQERIFQEQKTNIAREALQKRLEMEKEGPNDPVAVARLNAELQQLQTQHNLAMQTINNKLFIAENQGWLNVANGAKNSMAGAFTNILTGTMTLQQGLANMFLQIGQMIITELISKPLAAKIVAWATEKGLNVASALSYAGIAGAAGVASAAAIPLYGWMLAPEAGAMDYAAAAAFAASASAEGGYDIPAGVNPVTQLHQKEMVLPEEQAEVIRSLSGSGGSSSAGGSAGTMNINISAIDGPSVKKLFMDHGSSLLASLKNQNRNFAR